MRRGHASFTTGNAAMVAISGFANAPTTTASAGLHARSPETAAERPSRSYPGDAGQPAGWGVVRIHHSAAIPCMMNASQKATSKLSRKS